MKCSRLIGIVFVFFISLAWTMPQTTTSTARSAAPIGESLKKLTKQLIDTNSTSVELLDVRTPPKIKQQQKNKMKHREDIENSHAGIAIPVNEDDLAVEEVTKKMNFYKIERPTTNTGLSTWILLSGQITTPKSTTKKPVIKPPFNEEKLKNNEKLKPSNEERMKENFTVVVDTNINKISKPTFKKRDSSTTEKPTTKPSPIISTTKIIKETTKLTKIKASELNTAVNKKNITSTTTPSQSKKTTKPTSTESPISTTANNSKKTDISSTDSSTLKVEAKDEEVELNNNEDKKKKNKRKKNKNRRKKPEKNENTTSISKPILNQEKIGTQLYNYLAREIMPTVGAGLVGLMVTAGLATYFLYPFGIARRSDDTDRKDKEGSYYYSDEYSGGMLEEEAIGKVIAGMPANSLISNSYQSSSTRSPYANVHSKYRLVDRRANIQPQNYEGFVKGSVENVPLDADDYKPYKNEIENKKFVVGTVPKFEEATPVTVPEHGPRNLKFQDQTVLLVPAYEPRNINRKRRSIRERRNTNEPRNIMTIRKQRSGISNEIDGENIPEDTTVNAEKIKTEVPVTVTENATSITNVTESSLPTTTPSFQDKIVHVFDSFKNLLHTKAVIGLVLLHNITQSISKYLFDVQSRLDEIYRNSTHLYRA